MRVGLLLCSLALLGSTAPALRGQARVQPAGVTRAAEAAPVPVPLAAGRDSITGPSVSTRSRAAGAIFGGLVGAAVGGAAGYLWVKAQSHPNRELDFLAVLYGAAAGALVGLVVGAIIGA